MSPRRQSVRWHRRSRLTRAGPRAPGLGVDRSRRSHAHAKSVVIDGRVERRAPEGRSAASPGFLHGVSIKNRLMCELAHIPSPIPRESRIALTKCPYSGLTR